MKSFLAGVLVVGGLAVSSAQIPQGALPLDPSRERGASITPAFEGWYPNPDGSFSLLVGYYNRNTQSRRSISRSVPNNKVEPGTADQGQPTYFEIGRQWGVFVDQSAEGFRQQGRHVDDCFKRRKAVDSAHPEQGLSDHAVQGTGDGQPAAGPGVCRGRTKVHRVRRLGSRQP